MNVRSLSNKVNKKIAHKDTNFECTHSRMYSKFHTYKREVQSDFDIGFLILFLLPTFEVEKAILNKFCKRYPKQVFSDLRMATLEYSILCTKTFQA